MKCQACGGRLIGPYAGRGLCTLCVQAFMAGRGRRPPANVPPDVPEDQRMAWRLLASVFGTARPE